MVEVGSVVDKSSDFGMYHVRLPCRERNGMHILAARLNMSFDQIITLALKELIGREVRGRDRDGLDDDRFCNQLVGEYVNRNRGGWGYDSVVNDIPDEMKFLFVESDYDI
jgi:hypothetical protein